MLTWRQSLSLSLSRRGVRLGPLALEENRGLGVRFRRSRETCGFVKVIGTFGALPSRSNMRCRVWGTLGAAWTDTAPLEPRELQFPFSLLTDVSNRDRLSTINFSAVTTLSLGSEERLGFSPLAPAEWFRKRGPSVGHWYCQVFVGEPIGGSVSNSWVGLGPERRWAWPPPGILGYSWAHPCAGCRQVSADLGEPRGGQEPGVPRQGA